MSASMAKKTDFLDGFIDILQTYVVQQRKLNGIADPVPQPIPVLVPVPVPVFAPEPVVAPAELEPAPQKVTEECATEKVYYWE